MSKLPTLLVAGSLRLAAGEPEAGEAPIGYIVRWLRARMPEYGGHDASLANRILLVRAETGSGKSTVLPVAIFRILRSEKEHASRRFRGAGVICTQPRVLTAIALATDVSAERTIGGAKVKLYSDMVLGESVGFKTGPVSNVPASGLTYATAGVLAVQLGQQEDAEIMGRYRFIIVDEAHERSAASDMTLMLLRNFYERNAGNPRLPFLLLASATFDPARYASYFGVGPANIAEVKGRAYAIATHYPARGTNDYQVEAAAVVVRIHEEHADDPPEKADVLVFVPGAREATPIARALVAANAKYEARAAGPGPMLVLVINRPVVVSQSGDYPLVFEAPARLPLVGGRRPARRVIVSTVVAETGLTIDTLRYVVDCGWSREREVYHPWGAEGLVTRPAPQTRVQQRKGRAGRLFPGDFYPLYTENVHAALDEKQLPEIISGGVGEIYLAAVREQQRQKLRVGQPPEFRAEDMTLLDPPPPEAFLVANATALALGFVSTRAPLPARWPPPDPAAPERAGSDAGVAPLALVRGYGLTPLGHLAALFAQTPMEGIRVLLAGYVWGVAAADLVTVVAMFGTPLARLLRPGAGRALPAKALRAALPPYLVGRSGGGVTGPLPPSESEAFYFRARLLIADDFAEALLLFGAFARRIDAAQGDLGAVAAWCEEVDLTFAALLEVARLREAIIEDMLAAGLNPYREAAQQLSGLSAEAFTEGLVRLKRCLYDGLRGRLLRYTPEHPEGPGYVTRQGLRVKTPELFTDAMASRLKALRVTHPSLARLPARPLWILTDQVRLVPAPKQEEDRAPPLLYVAETNLVCVLSGFVSPDPDFDGPRTFLE
jgi:hypothetical protein